MFNGDDGYEKREEDVYYMSLLADNKLKVLNNLKEQLNKCLGLSHCFPLSLYCPLCDIKNIIYFDSIKSNVVYYFI